MPRLIEGGKHPLEVGTIYPLALYIIWALAKSTKGITREADKKRRGANAFAMTSPPSFNMDPSDEIVELANKAITWAQHIDHRRTRRKQHAAAVGGLTLSLSAIWELRGANEFRM